MKISVNAVIMLIRNNTALLTFEHPEFGYTERTFRTDEFPPARIEETITVTIEGGRPQHITLIGTVEWLDNPDAVVSYEHPKFGHCERKFPQSSLPPEAEARDEFDLVIELDERGNVCGYNPQRGRLKKYELKDWEKIPRPVPPANLCDEEALGTYTKQMEEYSSEVCRLRQAEIETRLKAP